jgi:stage V sporulation protein SpoVS
MSPAAPRRAPRGRAAGAATSALAELRTTGRLGTHGAQALYRTVRAVAVARNFPPPDGRAAWDTDGVAEVAHDFLADGRTPRRLVHLVVHATDDDSFDRLLHRMVLNWLRDRGRRTEIGRLMLRLRDVLGDDDAFVDCGSDRWRLASQPNVPSSADPAALVTAAAAEPDVDVPRWSPDARRKPPAADAPSLRRLCTRALDAAAGTVALDELARSIAPRLGVALVAIVHAVDDHDPLDAVPSPHHADASLDAMRAAEIFTLLHERERLLLSEPGTPVRALREVIGVGPSQAAEIQARLRAVIATELEGDDDYESVLFHLVDHAKAWAASRRAAGHPEGVPRLVNTT